MKGSGYRLFNWILSVGLVSFFIGSVVVLFLIIVRLINQIV